MSRKMRVGLLLLSASAITLMGAAGGWMIRGVFGPDPAGTSALPKNASEGRILTTLREMRERGGIRFGVPESDGRRLRLLVEATGARNVVEVGTSTGYSALWLCLGARSSGGHVTTFELDEKVAAVARENFRKAGVEHDITVIVGDAHQKVPGLNGPVDLVFLDADKEGYVDYLNKLLPLVRPGGLILAHNVQHASGYLQQVTTNAELDTIRLTQASGLSATLRRR